MVIKSKIYDFLKKNLGEYLYGFQKNQLDVGLLSGHIDLVNVNFRPSKVNQLLGSLGLPITLKAGLLGKLRLKCHYTSFLSSPIEVEIDELLLVFGPITHIAREARPLINDLLDDPPETKVRRPKHHNKAAHNDDWIETPRKTPEIYSKVPVNIKQTSENKSKNRENLPNGEAKKPVKKKKIVNENDTETQSQTFKSISIPPDHPRNYMEEPVYREEPKKEGLLEKYFSKVLKNLVLTVKSVHVQYEDETYPYLNPYSIGIKLEKIEVKNVTYESLYKDGKISKRNVRKNGIAKEINLSRFAMYIYSMASVLIPTSLWEATINSEIGIFEALPAYEVRDLIIMESNTLSNSHPSTFIHPTNVQLSVSFYEEAPTLRVSTYVEKAVVSFSSSMSECVRNFFDYCTNVQIWPLVLRFRPYCRIPDRPEKRERRKERKKRREIIRYWFQYAYSFVKTKRAAIRFMKERKKDNDLFKKMEKQEKIREKVLKGQREVAVSQKNLKNSNNGNARKLPGRSDLKLSSILKGFQEKEQPLDRRPYDGDQYFPKQITNSDIEFNMGGFKLQLVDEDTDVKMEINASEVVFVMNTLLNEMKTVFHANEFRLGFIDKGNYEESLKLNKEKKIGNEFHAIHICKIYRPAEVIIPNDIYSTLNMYDIDLNLAPIYFTYSKNILDSFFIVKKSLELDRCFRENVENQFISEYRRFCKKHNLPKAGKDLKKFAICKSAAMKIKEFQENIEVYIYDLNSDIYNIMFNVNLDLDGADISFSEGKKTLFSIAVNKEKANLKKDKQSTSVTALGFNLQTSNAPIAIHDFITTLLGICSKQLKQISIFSKYHNSGFESN